MQFLLKDLKVACPYFIMFVVGFFCLQTGFAEASSISKNYNELISKGGSQSGTCLLSGVEGSKKTPAVYGVYGSKVGGSAGDKGILCVPLDNSSLDSNTADSRTPAIKSEIQSLLDRIQALNNQIKNGVPNNTTKPDKINNSTEAPKACTIPTTTLAIGSKGTGVEQLQNVLSKTGHFKGDSTGYFGEQTREAVRSFQKSQGIVSSGDERSTGYGLVGEKTRGLFKKHCEGVTEQKEIKTTQETPKSDAVKSFRLKDVKTVTATSVDPSDLKADDEYTEYTVTLKDARAVTIKGHAGRGTEEVRYKPFRDAGYKGNVETLLKTATPKVLGVTTSSVEMLFGEVEERLEELQKLF